MSERFDAVIIGAGIIGAAIGYSLARRGWKTLNVDRLPAAGYGPTAGSCAIIRTYYSTLEGAAIAHEGWFYWKDWAGYLDRTEDERGLIQYHDIGAVVTKTEHNGHLKTIVANMERLGIPYEEWSPEEMARRFPGYDLRSFSPVRRPEDAGFGEPGAPLEGFVFFPRAGYVSDPQLATHNIQRAAEAKGAKFLFNTQVTEIRQDGGKVAGVTLADGREIDTPVVVNVAGPHSGQINRMAGVEGEMKITTKPLRQEVTHVPAPEGFKLPHVTSDSDIGVYCRPETGGHILIGSEDPECDPREYVDPDKYDESFTEQWTVQAYRYAQRLPALGIPNNRTKGVVALYDVTEDWIPIYDKSSLGGFYMAIGTSGNQFKNAPVSGELMAELIERCQEGRDHDRDPVTLELKHTGQTIDIGFYSRLREINQDSSFSVLG